MINCAVLFWKIQAMCIISDAEIAALATEDEREAAHQMNRRTVFRITSFDYVPE